MSKSILKTPLKFKEKIMLRLMLLSVWFIKNLSTIVYAAIITCVSLALFSVITPETPYLGVFFGGFSEDMQAIRNMEFTIGNITSILTKIGLLIGGVTLFIKKLKAITEFDVHSKKLKLLIYRAGYRYDVKNGSKLMKHAKIAGAKVGITVTDNIEELKPKEEENVVEGIKRVTNEFVSIITLKDDGDETVPLSENKNGIDVTQDKVVGKSLDYKEEEVKLSIIGMIKQFFAKLKRKLKIIRKVNTMNEKQEKLEKEVVAEVATKKETKKQPDDVVVVKRNAPKKETTKTEESNEKLETVGVVKEVVEKVIEVAETIVEKITPAKTEEVEAEEVVESKEDSKPKKFAFGKKKEESTEVKEEAKEVVAEQPKPVAQPARVVTSHKDSLAAKLNRFK